MTQTTLKQLDLEELRRLAHLPGPCITLQVPDSHPGAADGPRRALLRQLTHTAIEELGHISRPAHAEPIAQALKSFVESLDTGAGEGFTVFVAPGLETVCATPGVQPGAVAAAHFHLVPLIAAASAAKDFYALGVSRNAIRLWHVAASRCEEVVLPHSVPASLDAAGGFDRPDHDLENRSPAGGIGAARTIRFGTLSDHDAEAEYLHHYFVLVAKGLHEVVHEEPVFLIGTRPDTLAFRRAAPELSLFEAEWHANPAYATVAKVEREARLAAAVEAHRKAAAALAPLAEVRGKIDGPAAIFKAASEGRVRQLFLAEGARMQATAENPARNLYPREDMFNAAAVETLRTGGMIFVVPGEELPGGGAITATLRY